MALETHRHVIQRARALAFDLIEKRRRRAQVTIPHRLGVGTHDFAVTVEHSHRIGNDPEDGGELADEMREVLTQLLTFGDVDPRKDDLTSGTLVTEGAKDRLEHANPRPVAHRHAERAMNLAVAG